MDEATERRFAELEIRLAHHERISDELSAVLAEQARTIDLLKAQVARLRSRLTDLEAGWEPSPQDDKPPPHY